MFYNIYLRFRFASPNNYTTFAGVNSKDMKKTMLLLALCAMIVGCENSGEPTIDNHQPKNPKTWSPANKIYISETTYENSTASDKYWVWVLDFISKDSVIWYETDKLDLTYNGCPAYERCKYKLEYPNITLYFSIYDTRELKFIDTTKIDASIWDIVYTIRK